MHIINPHKPPYLHRLGIAYIYAVCGPSRGRATAVLHGSAGLAGHHAQSPNPPMPDAMRRPFVTFSGSLLVPDADG